MVLLDEGDLPVLVTKGEQVSVVAPIEELLPWCFLHLTFEKWQEIVAIQVYMVGLAAELAALHAIIRDGGVTCRSRKRGQEILVCEKVAVDGASLDHSRPTNYRGNAVTAFKVGGFLAPIRRAAAIGPGHHFRAIVRCI